MTSSQPHPDACDADQQTDGTSERSSATAGKKKRGLSMHEGIAVWCDCCSCEAEPYWAEMAEELGVDLGSDYEDEST